MYMKKMLPFLLLMMVFPCAVWAQVTTSNLTGVVKNSAGNAMPGATVSVLHIPTGTVYSAASRSGGQFDISNMNPGGPYTITVSFVGSENEVRTEVYLQLGETKREDFVLRDKSGNLTEVIVTGGRSTAGKTGTETTIGRDRLALLPTIGRNLNDYVRLTPQAKTTGAGGISIGGQNNRFNGFLIDGAVNNDVFGLSEQGTNGGRANTPPISIDAVDQIVIQVSPYDASLGNFTGGAINAITKSGTNEFHGSAYYIFRNENLAGKTPGSLPDSARTKLSKFNNKTYGFTIGGPIMKNKAFFFLNAEKQQDERLQPYLVSGNNTSFNVADTVAKLVNHLQTKYGYNPGDWINNPDLIDRTNINTRFDFNINTKNKLTLSYRYTKAERTNPGRSSYNGSTGSINFTNNAEVFPTTQHSGNIELNTKFSNKTNNKFRISATDVVDDRTFNGNPFPFVTIRAYNNGPTFNFGSEISSTANLLKQRIINFYDAYKIFAGKHALTIGADIDLNTSFNLFMNRNFGAYEYSALGPNGSASQINPLTAFIQDLGPSRYRRQYSLVDAGNKGGDANRGAAANFKSTRIGFFINDDVKVNNQLTLTFGLRADQTRFSTDVPTDQFFNDSALPVITQYYDVQGARSGQKFAPKVQISPRIGFKYNLDDENLTLRGGIGVFGGRTPLVWPGGVYQNNGITIGALDTARTTAQLVAAGTQFGIQLNGAPVAFRPDVDNQFTQTDFGLSPSLLKPQGDVNIISKNFRLPAVMKISLAADKRLGKGWTFTTEALFTKNISEVDWVNVNFLPNTVKPTAGPDKRDVYSYSGNPTRLTYRPTGANATIRNPYTNVILVRNTTGQKGYAYNFTIGIDKQSRKGLNFNATYTYGSSMVHNEGTSSINTSNWQNMEAVSTRNYLPLTQSDFSLGHRVLAFVSKKFTYAKDHASTTVALIYNGQSGNPFSYTMSNRSFIGDGVTNNDLMYIPATRAEMDQMVFLTRLTGATAAQNAADIVAQKDEYEALIKSNKYLSRNRGKYAQRNGARLPFSHILDFSLTQELSMKVGKIRHAVSVRFDMFNVANFLDKDAGRQYFLNFDQAQIISFEGFSGTVPTYKYQKPSSKKIGLISDGTNPATSSRWNGQLTFRYTF